MARYSACTRPQLDNHLIDPWRVGVLLSNTKSKARTSSLCSAWRHTASGACSAIAALPEPTVGTAACGSHASPLDAIASRIRMLPHQIASAPPDDLLAGPLRQCTAARVLLPAAPPKRNRSPSTGTNANFERLWQSARCGRYGCSCPAHPNERVSRSRALKHFGVQHRTREALEIANSPRQS